MAKEDKGSIFTADIGGPTATSGATAAAGRYAEAGVAQGAAAYEAIANLGKTVIPSAFETIKEWQAEKAVIPEITKQVDRLVTFDEQGKVEFSGKGATKIRALQETQKQLQAQPAYDNTSELVGSLELEISRIKEALGGGIINRREALARVVATTKAAKASSPILSAEIDKAVSKVVGEGVATMEEHAALFRESGAEKEAGKKAAKDMDDNIKYLEREEGMAPGIAAARLRTDPSFLEQVSIKVQTSKTLERAKQDAENLKKAKEARGALTNEDAVKVNTTTLSSASYAIGNKFTAQVNGLYADATPGSMVQGGVLSNEFWKKKAEMVGFINTARSDIQTVYDTQIRNYKDTAIAAGVDSGSMNSEVTRLTKERDEQLKLMEKPEGMYKFLNDLQEIRKNRQEEATTYVNFSKAIITSIGGDTLYQAWIADPKNVKTRFPEYADALEAVLGSSTDIARNLGLMMEKSKKLHAGEETLEDCVGDAIGKACGVELLDKGEQAVGRLGTGLKPKEGDAAALGAVARAPNSPTGQRVLKNIGSYERGVKALSPEEQVFVRQQAAKAVASQLDNTITTSAVSVLRKTIDDNKDTLSPNHIKANPVTGLFEYKHPQEGKRVPGAARGGSVSALSLKEMATIDATKPYLKALNDAMVFHRASGGDNTQFIASTQELLGGTVSAPMATPTTKQPAEKQESGMGMSGGGLPNGWAGGGTARFSEESATPDATGKRSKAKAVPNKEAALAIQQNELEELYKQPKSPERDRNIREMLTSMKGNL